MNIELRKKYQISDLINFYINQIETGNKTILFDFIDIFSETNINTISESTECYIDEPIDDDLLDEEENPEGYSDFVLQNNLVKICSGEVFTSVVRNTLYQKRVATVQDIILNLNFYIKNDNFLTLTER